MRDAAIAEAIRAGLAQVASSPYLNVPQNPLHCATPAPSCHKLKLRPRPSAQAHPPL